MNYIISIDIAYHSAEDVLNSLKLFSDKDITYKLLNVKGPAGGWPEFELTGTRDNLISAIKKLGYEEDEVTFAKA